MSSLYEAKFGGKQAGRQQAITLEDLDRIRDQLVISLRNEKPYALGNIMEYSHEITAAAWDLLEKMYPHMARQDLKQVQKDITDDIYGWGPISDLMKDPYITDIWVDRYNYIRYERLGEKHIWPGTFKSEAHLRRMAGRMAASVGRKVDEATPLEECRLPDGSRVSIVLNAVSLGGTTVTIRRFGLFLTLEDLAGLGMFDEGMIPVFDEMVRQKKNIYIVGGFGTGKNTTMNALLARVSHDESLVQIEDPAESTLLNAALNGPVELRERLPKSVKLFEPRHSNTEGTGEVTIDQIFRAVMKMKPSRVSISEIVDWRTTYYGLMCMNLGQPGSMFTGHASSPDKGLKKADTFLASYPDGSFADPKVRADMIAAIDIVIYIEQEEGRRYVEEICRVSQPEPGVLPVAAPVYRREGERLVAVGKG